MVRLLITMVFTFVLIFLVLSFPDIVLLIQNKQNIGRTFLALYVDIQIL